MYKYVKRMFDFLLAVVLIILLALPMLWIAFCIRKEDKGPVIFKQKRMGKDLKPFEIYKFRSMIQDHRGKNLSHEEMTTKIGKYLRKTSLDELPQIFNVLKGEMSFIGPRPWILEYYDYLTPQQKKRTAVLPGITGLAQVRGRNGISVLKKISYDLEYVRHFGIRYDIKILKESLQVVLGRKDSEITEKGIYDEISILKENLRQYQNKI